MTHPRSPPVDDVRAAPPACCAAWPTDTPVVTSRTLDELAGARVFVKCESFQRAGAFKFRGAYNAISQAPADERGAACSPTRRGTTRRRWRWWGGCWDVRDAS
jgi:threo-3-hydroxy-L-aspartate ammonia-lyase